MTWIISWLVGLGLGTFINFANFEESAIGRFFDLLPNVLGVLQSTFEILSFIPPIYIIIIGIGIVAVIMLRVVGR